MRVSDATRARARACFQVLSVRGETRNGGRARNGLREDFLRLDIFNGVGERTSARWKSDRLEPG